MPGKNDKSSSEKEKSKLNGVSKKAMKKDNDDEKRKQKHKKDKDKSKNKNKTKTQGERSTHGSKREKTKNMLKSEKASRDQGIKKPHRWRPGTAALREIKRQQKDCDLIAQRAPFTRVAAEIIQDLTNNDHPTRFGKGSKEMLQTVIESFLGKWFRDSNDVACMERLSTVMPRHLKFVWDRDYNDILQVE